MRARAADCVVCNVCILSHDTHSLAPPPSSSRPASPSTHLRREGMGTSASTNSRESGFLEQREGVECVHWRTAHHNQAGDQSCANGSNTLYSRLELILLVLDFAPIASDKCRIGDYAFSAELDTHHPHFNKNKKQLHLFSASILISLHSNKQVSLLAFGGSEILVAAAGFAVWTSFHQCRRQFGCISLSSR